MPARAPLQRPILLYNAADVTANQLVSSLKSGKVDCFDVSSTDVSSLLQATAGPRWAALLDPQQGGSIQAFSEQAGNAFLLLPNGSFLVHADRERWMTQYELEYWQTVTPPSASTQDRLRLSMFQPLESLRLRLSAAQPGTPWWAAPEAVQTWGRALADERFIVLDDFIPQQAATALAMTSADIDTSRARGLTDSKVSAAGRGDHIAWRSPADIPQLGPLVDNLNTLVSSMLQLPYEAVQQSLVGVSALSDAMFALYPGDVSGEARYIRHVDNEDGRNGRLLTCVYYLNDGWDDEKHGGQLRIFEPDQKQVKCDIAPKLNRLVTFFSDSTVPHEVRHAKRQRRAVTIWYLDQQKHLAYHSDEGQ